MTFLELVEQVKACFAPLDISPLEGEFGVTTNSERKVQQVGYATNLSKAVADRAIALGLDALITHHDTWDFLYESREAVYQALRSHQISHCFVHAPLDAAPFGTTVALAKLLSLRVVGEFAEYEGFMCGRICTPENTLSFDELAARLSAATGAGIRVWKNHDRAVGQVGITTGGGSMTDLVREASRLGCDTYITGESNLYMAQYAIERGVNLLIGTHTHTEFPGVESLCSKLQSTCPVEFVPLQEQDVETGTLILPG